MVLLSPSGAGPGAEIRGRPLTVSLEFVYPPPFSPTSAPLKISVVRISATMDVVHHVAVSALAKVFYPPPYSVFGPPPVLSLSTAPSRFPQRSSIAIIRRLVLS